jgi:hypothetical protein
MTTFSFGASGISNAKILTVENYSTKLTGTRPYISR